MQDDTPVSIFDVMTDAQRQALEALGTKITYPENDTIFREGQPSRSVVVIKTGKVMITQRGPDGVEVPLANRTVGEVLGDEGVLMGEPRSATITTVTPLEGMDVSAADLRKFINQEHLWPEMYRAAVVRRRESDYRAVIARLNVRHRLSRLLLDQVKTLGRADGDDWVIENAYSQQEIAHSIGASREAVSGALQELRKEGLVTTGRRQYVLHDIEALRVISPH